MAHSDTLFLAADPGAGNLKIFSQHCPPVMIRSLVKFGTEKDFIADYESVAPDVLHYVAGSNAELAGRLWIAGGSVIDRKLRPDTPYEESNLKTTNALPLLLAALIREAQIPAGETNVVMICSSHNPKALGAKLVAQFTGWHQVVCNGKTYKIQIKMPVSGVISEGSAIAQGTEFCTLDIGYLTCLLTPRSRDGIPLNDQTHRSGYGVGNLIDRITNHSELQAMLGGMSGNPIYVGNGLVEATEGGMEKVFYRGDGKCLNITSVYTACLKEWIVDAVGPALKALAERNGSDYRVIAIGGGVKLPKIEGFLGKRGIRLYEGDPLLANAESMYTHKLLPLLSGELNESLAKFDFDPFDTVAKCSATSKKPKAKAPTKAESKEPAVA
ncbi:MULTISPECIES: hypothetical protein [Cyanophyceae]|uniref:hypothetical protein n=1 Tax=Cyanophyceae TaxID=3028117 RepID=UPI00168672F4|nr:MULTISPECIES: hypothetical protein [Cyanophyceae]MBD1914284.1 hypothetical protein [Phormidium sp. FACHB-77]MBD2031219.1 hypothetical protein [Phormidium sp. FACHB-322]MBD2049618.1 hypothetical protein [Leptolyngbya sp. FACHB-60]